jgi:hypothetical protein
VPKNKQQDLKIDEMEEFLKSIVHARNEIRSLRGKIALEGGNREEDWLRDIAEQEAQIAWLEARIQLRTYRKAKEGITE